MQGQEPSVNLQSIFGGGLKNNPFYGEVKIDTEN